VRLQQHEDGSAGAPPAGCAQRPVSATDHPLRCAAPRFRLGENAARPLILIGNGSGLAGLRGHLKARPHRIG
jgi:sulfite reductase (NADPH) flavoprotein alpha-component